MPSKHRKRKYGIVLTSHGKVLRSYGFFYHKDRAVKKFKKLIKENHDSVVFPKEYIKWDGIKTEADYELYILKRKAEGDTDCTLLRDNNGEFIEHEVKNTHSGKWLAYDRDIWYMEEGFWVYGYNPRYYKKTFEWILENMLLNDIDEDYMFKNVLVYGNKLLIDSSGKLDFVVCRDKSQAIKLYNMLQERCDKAKVKNILFSGNMTYRNRNIEIINRLEELTGWSRLKIRKFSLFNFPPLKPREEPDEKEKDD